jgi:hypothetical protein
MLTGLTTWMTSAYEGLTPYHILGTTSALIFLLTWYGLGHQVALLSKLKSTAPIGYSQSLSLNQFVSSYFAFYANFFFGIALNTFNHYLVWTRLGALVLILAILWRIACDRQQKKSLFAFWIALAALIFGLISIGLRPFPPILATLSDTIILLTTLLLAQGTFSQIRTTQRHKQPTQALSKRMLISLILKDATTLAFACTIPFHQAWPLILLNTTSLVTRSYLLQLLITKIRSRSASLPRT